MWLENLGLKTRASSWRATKLPPQLLPAPRPPWAHPGVKATTLPQDRLPHSQEDTPNPKAWHT